MHVLIIEWMAGAQDSKKNTPLHYAAGYGRSAIVRQLLEAGAQAATENASGQSALDLVTCALIPVYVYIRKV